MPIATIYGASSRRTCNGTSRPSIAPVRCGCKWENRLDNVPVISGGIGGRRPGGVRWPRDEIRIPPAFTPKTHCRPHVDSAVRPAITGIESTARPWLGDESETGGLQQGLQPDNHRRRRRGGLPDGRRRGGDHRRRGSGPVDGRVITESARAPVRRRQWVPVAAAGCARIGRFGSVFSPWP